MDFQSESQTSQGRQEMLELRLSGGNYIAEALLGPEGRIEGEDTWSENTP